MASPAPRIETLTDAAVALPASARLDLMEKLANEFSYSYAADPIFAAIDELRAELAAESVIAASGRDSLADPYFTNSALACSLLVGVR